MLIAFEGIHNSGKSTIIQYIKENLEKQGIKVFVSEWNSHPMVKDTLYELRDSNKLCNPLFFFYMQMLDLIYRYDLDVKAKLAEGYVVLMDRYIYTAYVRGIIRNIDKRIINSMCNHMQKCDYCFILDIPVEQSIARGIPSDNSVWQAGLGTTTFSDEFDTDGYQRYLSKQRELYLDLAKGKNDYIITQELFDERVIEITNIVKMNGN